MSLGRIFLFTCSSTASISSQKPSNFRMEVSRWRMQAGLSPSCLWRVLRLRWTFPSSASKGNRVVGWFNPDGLWEI